MNHFSVNFKKIRMEKEIPLTDIARKTNYDLEVLRAIEEGVLEPDIHLLVLISNVLGSNPNELLGYSLSSFSSVFDIEDIQVALTKVQ